jgi:hypothetical protein
VNFASRTTPACECSLSNCQERFLSFDASQNSGAKPAESLLTTADTLHTKHRIININKEMYFMWLDGEHVVADVRKTR